MGKSRRRKTVGKDEANVGEWARDAAARVTCENDEAVENVDGAKTRCVRRFWGKAGPGSAGCGVNHMVKKLCNTSEMFVEVDQFGRNRNPISPQKRRNRDPISPKSKKRRNRNPLAPKGARTGQRKGMDYNE